MVIATILALTVGALLVSGHRAWRWGYSSAHQKIREDARVVMIAFGSMGRRSNRLSYTIYNLQGGTFVPAEPVGTDGQEVVSGEAVEFRYWDVALDEEDSHGLMDVTKTATAYAFFYLDGGTLKADYGPYPPGAVPEGSGSRNTAGIRTVVLAENVSTDPNIGAFSHTTINGEGRGCVRINIKITDPEDGRSVKVMTATLMRNIWPR